MNLDSKTITFIGGGNMARSLIGGLIQQGMPATNIQVIEPNSQRASSLTEDFSIGTQVKANSDALKVDIIFLAVKPQILKMVCRETSHFLKKSSALIVSIAAGIKTNSIREWLDTSDSNITKIIRAMPNTPALIGLGATGLFCNEQLDDLETLLLEYIFDAIGLSVWLDSENQLDVVTAISGSGPAYFFKLYEHLIAAGIEQGLDAETAQQLVMQTALGAAQMAKKAKGKSISTLRINVTSKGGTTEAGLKVLEEQGFESIIKKTIQAAKARSQALANELL